KLKRQIEHGAPLRALMFSANEARARRRNYLRLRFLLLSLRLCVSAVRLSATSISLVEVRKTSDFKRSYKSHTYPSGRVKGWLILLPQRRRGAENTKEGNSANSRALTAENSGERGDVPCWDPYLEVAAYNRRRPY